MASTGTLSGGADTLALTDATGDSRARANEFYRQLALLQQQYQQQLAAQSATIRGLDRTIAGTAPSVAGTQLQAGLGQTRNAISAQAAGAGGNNAALANYGGIQALAQAQAKQQQDAAMLRAKEVTDAQALKAGILNQQQQATGNMAGQATGASTALSGQGLGGSEAIASANQHENDAERNLASGVLNSGGAVLTKVSDENAKTEKKPVGDSQMDQFLKHVAGFTYKYKDEANGKGGQVGPMAQDVNKGGPIGQAISDGHKLDLGNAVGALLAAIGHVNRKIDSKAA